MSAKKEYMKDIKEHIYAVIWEAKFAFLSLDTPWFDEGDCFSIEDRCNNIKDHIDKIQYDLDCIKDLYNAIK